MSTSRSPARELRTVDERAADERAVDEQAADDEQPQDERAADDEQPQDERAADERAVDEQAEDKQRPERKKPSIHIKTISTDGAPIPSLIQNTAASLAEARWSWRQIEDSMCCTLKKMPIFFSRICPRDNVSLKEKRRRWSTGEEDLPSIST